MNSGMSSLAQEYRGNNRARGKLTYVIPGTGDRFLFYFLLALPVINAIADSTIYYFVEADSEGGMHPGIIRGILLLIFIFLFGYKRITKDMSTRFILIFLGYLFILTLFSSNVRVSFLSGYVKWFFPLMMFPVGLYFFKTLSQLVALNKAYVLGALIVCINLGVAQFTEFGISAYVDKSFYTGGAGVGITNQLAFVLLTFPFLIRQRFSFSTAARWLIYIVGFFSLVFVIVAMKRAGIISLFAGALIYLYLTQSKARFIRYFIIVCLIFFLVLPAFKVILAERYNARMKQMEDIENEARYKEIFYVIREFREGNVSQKLFGREVFNTGQFFGKKYFHTNRMIHGDLSSFLYGSGLIGLLLYLSVFSLLFMEGRYYRRMLLRIPVYRELFAIYFAVLLSMFLISLSGSGTIGEKCMVFLLLGAIIGLARIKVKAIIRNAG